MTASRRLPKSAELWFNLAAGTVWGVYWVNADLAPIGPGTPASVEYRPANESDAEMIASLHARSWRENYRGAFTDAFLDGDLAGERLRTWRERLDCPPGDQFVQLAVEGSTLLGFVCAYGGHDPQWGSFVDNLHVAKESKRKGVGTSLMRQTGAWLARRYPDMGVYLLVLEVNASARRFYERLGAKNAGVSNMETHGGAVVRSCRYIWPSAAVLALE